MTTELVTDWIINEIKTLPEENNELLPCKSGMHPNPCAVSNSWRMEKSNACRAKIEAYIKLIDYIEELKDAIRI